MERVYRIPNLTLPFGVLGALVGWISASALGNPLLRAGRNLDRSVAAVGGGVTAALLGAYLMRRTHPPSSDPFAVPERVGPLSLVLPLAAGGALTGGIVGAAANNVSDGVKLGLACGIAAVPLCLIVLAAALRAERAPLGSLVADADRREVWAVLVLAASLASIAELPGGPAWATLGLPGPWVSLAVALLAVPVTLALHVRDRMARRSLGAATEEIRAREHDHAPPSDLPRLDLGLGDELSSRYAKGSSAYRDHEREVAVVIGSPEEAGRAIRWAIRRGAACLALVLLVAIAHGIAIGPWLRVDYAMALCNRREPGGCAGAARALAQRDPLDPRIGPLYARDCDMHDRRHCASFAAWFEQNPALERQAEATRTAREICAVGYHRACLLAHRAALHTGDAAHAKRLRERACNIGDCPPDGGP